MKLRIFIKSFNNNLINLASKKLESILSKTDMKIKGLVALPTRIKRFCVLRSPHIDKDSREHFELRLYKSFVDIEGDYALTSEILSNIEFPTGIDCTFKYYN